MLAELLKQEQKILKILSTTESMLISCREIAKGYIKAMQRVEKLHICNENFSVDESILRLIQIYLLQNYQSVIFM